MLKEKQNFLLFLKLKINKHKLNEKQTTIRVIKMEANL